MNVLEEKLIEWSEKEFGIKNHSKDSLNFLRSKNGNTFKKLMTFMSNRIKSKKNGEQIKRFCYSIECQNQLKIIDKEIKDIESKISDIRSQLLAEELNKKSVEIKQKLNQNKEFISTLILDAIENICAKNKLCTQLKPNLKTIDETIASYENLFTFNHEFDSKINGSSDETSNTGSNALLSQDLEQINQLITRIDSVLYDLTQIEVNKPIKPISIDPKSVLSCFVESNPVIDIKPIGEEKDKKRSAITSKLVSAQNLMNKYQTIRSEKLSKNKEKLEKVINSCNEFIQQNV